MTEEIKLGVYERLLNDYESDKEKHAADLAYAACCLVDTVTSEEIAGNENAITLAVGLPLALSSIDEEIWKGYLSKPVNGTEKLKEFLEGVDAWNRGNLSEDSDFDSLLKVCECLDDNWYSKYFVWAKFCESETGANFEDKNDVEKWLKEASSLWEQAKSDRFKRLLCLNDFFSNTDSEGTYLRRSLYLEKPSKKSKEPRQQSFFLAQKIIEDSIKIFTAEKKQDPFGLFLLGFLLENAGWEEPPNCKYIFELCINGRLSQAAIYLVGLLDEDEQEYHQEALKWYEKGAKLGNPYTQGVLACLYEDGNEGVLQDLSKARDWNLKALAGLERLGNKGDFRAMTVIASYYANGVEGIPVNTFEALKWHKRALPIAEKHKDTESKQKILIGKYEIYSSNQEWKDMKKLASEAQSGDVAAMQAIGDRYLNGDTVPQNLNEACKWYKKASNHLKMSFFDLAIESYEDFIDNVENKNVFTMVVEKALELNIVHTEEFLICFQYIPNFDNNADRSKKAKKLINHIHNCFDKHDPKFVEKIEEKADGSYNGYYSRWAGVVGRAKSTIKTHLKELLITILKKSPEELTKFIKEIGGKFKGFGLAQFSELCILLRPEFYLVMNGASDLTKIVKKNKILPINNEDYVNYPSLCKKINQALTSVGFSCNYRGHFVDKFFCEHDHDIEDHLSEILVENFRILVSQLLGISEGQHFPIKNVKTQNDSDVEIRDLDWDLIFKKFFDQAQEKLEGKYSVNILLDILKERLVSNGYKYDDDIERRFLLWVKRNLPQNPNMKA